MLSQHVQTRSLTVKETILETRVDKAEGMNVSCFGIGLIRRPTFCRAVERGLAEELCLYLQVHLSAHCMLGCTHEKVTDALSARKLTVVLGQMPRGLQLVRQGSGF